MFHGDPGVGLAIITLGAGMLLACLLHAGAVCVFCGIGLIVLGAVLFRRK